MDNHAQAVFDQAFLRNENDLQDFLLYLLKGGLNKQSRDAVGSAAAQYVAQRTAGDIFSSQKPFLNTSNQEIVNALRATGCAVIEPVFSDGDLREIDTYISYKKVHY